MIRLKIIAMTLIDGGHLINFLTQTQELCLRDLRRTWAEKYSGIQPNQLELFETNIDKPHARKWHEFSIKEHSLRVVKGFEDWISGKDLVLGHIIPPDVIVKIRNHLEVTIDGKSKIQLFILGLALHDIGKYEPTFYRNGDVSYENHEQKSERMIASPDSSVYRSLLNRGYTEAQIVYISKVAGLHYELARLRQSQILAKQFDFFNTDYHINEPLKYQIALLNNAHYAYEMGLSFLFDNLGKTNVPPLNLLGVDPNLELLEVPDSQIERDIVQWLTENNIDLELVKAIKELPVNLKFASNFLQYIAHRERDPILQVSEVK